MSTDQLFAQTLVPLAELRPLMARSNKPAVRQIFGLVLALIGAGMLVWAARDSWLVWPAMFTMGLVWVHLFAAQHECAHRTAFRSMRANNWLAWVCGALIMVPALHFRYEHTAHHTHTNLIGQDSELIPMPATFPAYFWYLSGLPYWASNGLGLLRRSIGKLTGEEIGFIPTAWRSRVILESRVLLLLYAACGVAIATGAHALLFYWVIPLLLGQPVMRFIRMTEHVGCAHERDPARNTRSTRVAWPWQFLAWNMNFHGEHHLSPLVPFHALPALNRLLQGQIPVRNGYIGGHREIWAGLRDGKGPEC